MWSNDKWTRMGKTGTIAQSLSFSPFLVPLKGSEIMYVGFAATCCGALYRIRMGYSLVTPQRNRQKERVEDAYCYDQVKNKYIIS